MDRDVVEGNSTSLESSARLSGPQEPPALMDLSRFHMNDLGLTPFPGSQPQGRALQDEEQICVVDPDADNVGCGGVTSVDETGGFAVLSQTDNTSKHNAVTNEAFYDPLFDCAVPELDFAFSRKRVAEEPEEFLPEKRQHLQPPDDTPSLTTDSLSTESTHPSPASFFDAFDNIFGGGFDIPLPSPGDELPEYEDFTGPPSLADCSISEATKKRFSLNEQDVISNTTREILRVPKDPEYVSPYPVSGGKLGYLPSAPGIHVKCVALSEGQKYSEILSLRAKIGQLTRERDYYKRTLAKYATTNGNEKKSEETLREENAMLRRVSSRHQDRVKQYKKEAMEWRNKLNALSVVHNNLLYEIGVQKRIPNIVPIPEGYKPPRIPRSIQGQISGQFTFHPGDRVPPPQQAPAHAIPQSIPQSIPQEPVQSVQSGVATPQSGVNIPAEQTSTPQQSCTPQQASCPEPQQPVTIDLTEDEPSPDPASEPERRTVTLQALRSKNYDWLSSGRNTPSAQSQKTPRDEDDELSRMMEEELSRA